MSRRRKLFVAVALFVTPLAVVGVACTFPDVSFQSGALDGNDALADSSSSNSDGSQASEDSDIPIVLPDGRVIGDEVIDVPPDSGIVVDAAECEAKCDCDNDGYLKTGCTKLTEADDPDAGKAGAGDCLDTDPNVHPGITKYVKSKPTPPNQGDWNCVDGIERSIPLVTPQKCSGAPPVTSCVGTSGELAETPTPCGEIADYYTCQANDLLQCEYQFSEQRIQNCK